MKRISSVFLIPLVLFALERVNLIKDASFEKDSEVWHTNITGGSFPNFAASVTRYDSEKSYSGNYSGSGDNRSRPNPIRDENTFITQGFLQPKNITDVDSLFVYYSVLPLDNQPELTFAGGVYLHLNAQHEEYWIVGYFFKASDLPSGVQPPLVNLEALNFPEDTFWYLLSKDVYWDISEYELHDIPLDATLDSIILRSSSNEFLTDNWRGQKIFFDDVRLMGYADYDVGVKEILGYDDLYPGEPYTPEVRIKNFGRLPTDSFLVIAEIRDFVFDALIYCDTIVWSLPADTEDTLEFRTHEEGFFVREVEVGIRTIMEPDESDANDDLSKIVIIESINEPPPTRPNSLDLKVNPICTHGVLKVSFETPKGQVANLTLFDASGRRVASKQVRGYGSVTFDTDLTKGVYFIKLNAVNSIQACKVIILQ